MMQTMALLLGIFFSIPALSQEDWSFKRVSDLTAIELGETAGHYLFTLKPDTKRLSEGARQELSHPRRFRNGDQVFFQMWTQFPRYEEGHPKSLVVMQWHESMKNNLPHRRPPLAHRWRKGYLEITVWNDKVFAAQGIDGDGELVARLKVTPESWYQFRYQILFGGEEGFVFAQFRECPARENCNADWQNLIHRKGSGFGYDEAADYYFKFGVYTTLTFDRAVRVEHIMSPQDLSQALP